MKVLANDFRRRWLETRQDTMDAVEAVGSSGWYVLGTEVEAFEAELAKLWGAAAIGVASGMDAIEISLRALGCGPGHKVLTSPISAFASTLAILNLGATPVFCDVDAYGLLDLDCCEAALARDRDIRYFVPVHLYGHSLDVRRLEKLRTDFEIALVEDCAQSILASHNGRATGTAGQLAATSFYPTKNLGALGDAGAVLTGVEELADLSRTLRDYGQTAKYRHEAVGYNSRLDELQAAILRRAHLPRLKRWTERRKQIARAYNQGIRHAGITVPGTPCGSDSCWHLYPVFVAAQRKPDFMEHMRAREIGVGEHYPVPIFEQPVMRSIEFELVGGMERARRLCQSQISLPIHPYLSDTEIAAVMDACNSWRG